MALAAVLSKAVVLLLLIHWLLLPLLDYVIILCFVVHYFVFILALQSSQWGRESWLLCFVCLPGIWWLLCGSFSQCHRFVCSWWLWYFLIILTIFDNCYIHGIYSYSQALLKLKLRVRINRLIFLLFNQNICCGYSKEPSQWDGSFEHPKHMLKCMGKKIFTILHSKFCHLNLCTVQLIGQMQSSGI